jgi:hypothetical protein
MPPAYVVMRLPGQLAADLQSQRPGLPSARKIKEAVARHGAALAPATTPTEAGTDEVYLSVSVSEMQSGHRLAEELRGITGVEAAYVKPGEELP